MIDLNSTIMTETRRTRDGGHVFSLPKASRFNPVPLLGRTEKEISKFVHAMGACDENGNLYPGQVLRHSDGVTNIRLTHPTDDPTVAIAYCVACKKFMSEATMDKHCRVNNKNACKFHPAMSRIQDDDAYPDNFTATTTAVMPPLPLAMNQFSPDFYPDDDGGVIPGAAAAAAGDFRQSNLKSNSVVGDNLSLNAGAAVDPIAVDTQPSTVALPRQKNDRSEKKTSSDKKTSSEKKTSKDPPKKKRNVEGAAAMPNDRPRRRGAAKTMDSNFTYH